MLKSTVLRVFLCCLFVCLSNIELNGAVKDNSLKGHCFKIKVVDEQTGRGVPLVELRTTNLISYFTDSNGIVAFHEPGLMNQRVFFELSSHGYEYPKDGFGYAGKALEIKPGATETIRIKRINIAERLYRVTGQGIYRDSIIAGEPVPLANPAINGLVVGQDSVFTCLYRGRLYWFWGDTARPAYPLGIFSMSGAWSKPPQQGGLDPAVGVDLNYFVDETGFSRNMSPLPEPGLVWLDGIMVVKDDNGRERMIGRYARLKGLSETLGRGFVAYDDDTETFKRVVKGDLDFLPYTNTGHAFPVRSDGIDYYYFTSPSPLGVRLRVPARWNDAMDPDRYEVLTAIGAKEKARWILFGDLMKTSKMSKAELLKALEQEAKGVHIFDIESGKKVLPHNGTVYYNAWRQCWIAIFVQHFGSPSMLGEVWYAESDTPVGPWGYARKIVTHDKYSFYNPKQHPLFDQQEGKSIYFEGTYSHTFSGSKETATPRYDYNQIMYRLDLSDERMHLPQPLYHVRMKNNGFEYLFGREVQQGKHSSQIDKIAFCAIAPERKYDGLIPIYKNKTTDDRTVLDTSPVGSTEPLFYALEKPPVDDSRDNHVVALFEYINKKDRKRIYSTGQLPADKWSKSNAPLCYIWKSPKDELTADWQAKSPY